MAPRRRHGAPRTQELEAIGPCLEGTRDLGRYADGVERMHVEDLVVELDLAGAAENQIWRCENGDSSNPFAAAASSTSFKLSLV
jgi:hypothetical protein